MSEVNLDMRETTAAKIVGLVRDHMPGGDERSFEGKRLADMPCDSEAPPVGEFIEADRQRRFAKPEYVGTADIRQRYPGRHHLTNRAGPTPGPTGKDAMRQLW